jgi:thiamine monophosphate synthase
MAAGADMACVISAAVAALDVEAACHELTSAMYGP